MSKSSKDTLFQIHSVEADFEFSERVVEVFDDMLDRSIPFYKEVIQATAELLDTILLDDDLVVDLGCATGTTLLEFSRLIEKPALRYLGIDNATAMLKKGQLKAELYSKQDQITFLEEDITRINLPGTGAFILNYTLQFVRPVLRQEFIETLLHNLRPGGILILSEKIINHDPLLNRKFIELYHRYKKKKGYTELEIAKKREALENILIPFSIPENINILKKAGFHSVETYFQWLNFVSIIAVKPS